MPAAIAYAALLRAVNVGGTSKLAMTDLARLCEREGLCDVKTYIQSGNVVFTSPKKEAAVKAALEKTLERHMGKPVSGDGADGRRARGHHRRQPVPRGRRRTGCSSPSSTNALTKADIAGVVAPGGERLAIRGRELFIHYPDGMGVSKLKVPALKKAGTGRNLNTVVKLAAMTRALA